MTDCICDDLEECCKCGSDGTDDDGNQCDHCGGHGMEPCPKHPRGSEDD